MPVTDAGLRPLPLVDVTALLPPDRAALLELLSGLDADEWQQPTECPAWNVGGVALHVLGDDLSLLSRQRDAGVQGLVRYGESHPGLNFRQLLDGFNEQWVTAAEFLSPELIVALLDATGRWTADFYSSVDPHELNEPVGLFAVQDASPYWQISAREYLERFIHQHQIRRATRRPDLGREFLVAAGEVVAHMIAAHAGGLTLQPGTTIGVEIDGVAGWTVELGATAASVFSGVVTSPSVAVTIDADAATPVLSRGLTAREVKARLCVTGPDDLANTLTEGFALLAGRP